METEASSQLQFIQEKDTFCSAVKQNKLSNIRICSLTKLRFCYLIQNQFFEKEELGYLSMTGLR